MEYNVSLFPSLPLDMTTVNDYIQRLESVIDSKFEKIHACLQKQSDFVGERTTRVPMRTLKAK
jgi:hypothetical protein